MIILAGHEKRVDAVAFSPDGSWLASCSKDQTVRLWDLRDGSHRILGRDVGDGFRDGCVAFSPDSRWLAHFGYGRGLCVWDVETSATRRLLPISASFYGWAMSFARDGRLAVGQFPRQGGYQVVSWQVGSWHELRPPLLDAPHPHEVASSLAFEPCGERLLLGNGILLDGRTGERLQRLPFIRNHSLLAWCPGRPLVAVGGSSNAAQVFDVDAARLLGKVQLPAKEIQGLAFTPDGRWLLTVSNEETVKGWDTETFGLGWEFAWEIGQLKRVAVAADGMRAAAGGHRGQIVVWDID